MRYVVVIVFVIVIVVNHNRDAEDYDEDVTHQVIELCKEVGKLGEGLLLLQADQGLFTLLPEQINKLPLFQDFVRRTWS